jgi:hypothetical protein
MGTNIRLAGCGVLAMAALAGLSCLGFAAPAAPAAGSPGVAKTVRYLGYRFSVPRGWPVIDDTRHRRACVRFDRHAVYLGSVSSDQSCPSRLLGTTESILIQPGPASGPAVSTEMSTENPVTRQVSVSAPGISITATFGSDPALIYQILASAGLPAPTYHVTRPQPAADLIGRALARSPARSRPVSAPPLPPTIENYSGLGFDTCAAPSRRNMLVWRRASRYRAIGIYIGGADRTCAQPNLTRAWLRAEVVAGWRIIPLYAGPQADFGELVAPARQGRAAAMDAAAAAGRLGFAPQTPLYYDMEGFPPIWNTVALSFLLAWTREVHRLGYASGVYSSGDSGIVDLVRHYRRHVHAMPDVIYVADWNGSHSTAIKRLYRLWLHKRIHQFTGQTTQAFGGITMDINKDFLDMREGAAYVSAFTSQQTSAVNLPDGSTMVFYRQGRQLWLDRHRRDSGWTRPVPVGVRAWSTPSVVWTGSVVAVFYKDAAGRLGVLSYRENGRLIGKGVLRRMGTMGLGPSAVSQPGGVIDVFWRAAADHHLWHGQFTPGSGWSRPQNLGGDLRSPPSPVTSSPGSTTVFWAGTDNHLWMVSRGLSGTWSRPRRLGIGLVRGSPQATAQPTGGIEVYWSGSREPGLREGFASPRTGWHGPRDLGGELRSVPLPVTSAGVVQVLWLGPGHQIYYVEHRAVRNWNALGWTDPATARLSWAGSAPFAAVGGERRTVRIFWRGRRGSLWTATLTGTAWSRSFNL